MPCIIVGFYWLAKDICATNKKSGGIFSKKNGGIVMGECYFCSIQSLRKKTYSNLILKLSNVLFVFECVYKVGGNNRIIT
ncbi:hypothetical protein FLL97_14565 [Vibrio cholerae]|nr:hypothetical protein FLL97_14565 [Vibrio cholerae]TQP87461.1 hypothetical protein FLL74_12410 [Vibrio cholerae]